MAIPYARAPHQGAGGSVGSGVHAALLIDFDNVTMGMRSDLSKDLKKLLQSDIIKGKVTVQRAYADWRRYPQYIVPLSEASIDLIFAPAYGSSKKNATDIRMAIDGMELVFTRPEIGTFILLTGDSDFSSLVLKLKEYGKYVIGVGIQESSSDILVQNCDEYYSYTSITGLRKTTDSERTSLDPWVLVEKAVNRMAERDDVMRSDRLKQVMIELDPGFDEGDFGYSKFSRFLSEAAGKGLVQLRKLENGQYEVGPAGSGRGDGRRRRDEGAGAQRAGGERGGRGRGQRERPAESARGESARRAAESRPAEAEAAPSGEPERAVRVEVEAAPPLAAAYDLLRRALQALREQGRESVRDSDVKRRMLDLDGSFDEAALGFAKFSRFLRQAHDHEVVNLQVADGGNYEVSLGGAAAAPAEAAESAGAEGPPRDDAQVRSREASVSERPAEPVPAATAEEAATEPLRGAPARPAGMGPRRGSTRRRTEETGQLSILEGQVPPGAPRAASPETPPHGTSHGTPLPQTPAQPPPRGSSPGAPGAGAPARGQGAPPQGAPVRLDVEALGLPTDAEAQIRYLTNSYRGVGRKTAEALVERFGQELYSVLQNEPARIEGVVPAGRAEQLLEGWRADFERRAARVGQPGGNAAPGQTPAGSAAGAQAAARPEGGGTGGKGRRTRRGGRRGGGQGRPG